MLKIAIADDHTTFRKTLAMFINNIDGFEVVLEAGNGQELLAALCVDTVDIVLLDLQMPIMDGFETNSKIQELYPDVKVLILTQLHSRSIINRIVSTGIYGYFTKNTDPFELEKVLKKIERGGFYFENNLAPILLDIIGHTHRRQRKVPTIAAFTKREKEILALTLKEYSGAEIADILKISPRTIDTHKTNLIAKTNSKNFIGVIIYAHTYNIMSIEDISEWNVK